MSGSEDDSEREIALRQATWAGRFGWLGGGATGVFAGFVLTWWLETRVLQGRVANATDTAIKLSGAIVPLLFIAGALAGHGFGARGGATRLKLLGSAAGLLISALAWAFLVVTR